MFVESHKSALFVFRNSKILSIFDLIGETEIKAWITMHGPNIRLNENVHPE